jgi:hypothetical protein
LKLSAALCGSIPKVCNLTAGKDHRTYDLALSILNEGIEHESWFPEFLGEGPSGHFMRRGETSPFVSKFLRWGSPAITAIFNEIITVPIHSRDVYSCSLLMNSDGAKKNGIGIPYSIIGTGIPYPPYGRGISRMGFIVARSVAMISADERVYRTSPI